MTAPLGWGRRYLMCPPVHFGVLYEINPWMHREVSVDHDRARGQWDALVATLRAAGAEVETMDAHPDVPDLVFTANAGLVDGGRRGVQNQARLTRRGALAFVDAGTHRRAHESAEREGPIVARRQ